MPSLLLYRAAALVTLGVIAGGLHATIHAKVSDKPVTLRLLQPGVIDWDAYANKGNPAPAPSGIPATSGTPAGAPSSTPARTGNTPASQPPTPPPPAAADPMDEINITIAQAKLLHDNRVVFLDARHLNEYEEGHVAGALWLTTESFATPGGGEVMGVLDRDAPVVVYCGGGMCDASKNLVRLLQQAGFMQARIMHDGYPEWVKAGHPTQTGKPPIGGN